MTPSVPPLLSSPQTNALYRAAFEEWASHFTNVKILSDETRSNDVNATLQLFSLSTPVTCFDPSRRLVPLRPSKGFFRHFLFSD